MGMNMNMNTTLCSPAHMGLHQRTRRCSLGQECLTAPGSPGVCRASSQISVPLSLVASSAVPPILLPGMLLTLSHTKHHAGDAGIAAIASHLPAALRASPPPRLQLKPSLITAMQVQTRHSVPSLHPSSRPQQSHLSSAWQASHQSSCMQSARPFQSMC